MLIFLTAANLNLFYFLDTLILGIFALIAFFVSYGLRKKTKDVDDNYSTAIHVDYAFFMIAFNVYILHKSYIHMRHNI